MLRLLHLVVVASLTLVGLVQPVPAGAWGRFGHLTVCDLAYRNFTPATRAVVKDLLRSDAGGITVEGRGRMADRHYKVFNVGCLEEDALPRRHADDHFINVARSESTIGADCPAGGECILAGVERDLAILRDRTRSREDRVFALMALGHWIGDIHQPLHISFADDRGGNGILAMLAGRCGTSRYRVENLHGVWDNCLLEAGMFERVRRRADFKRSWGKDTITYRAVDTLQANTGLSDERAMVGGGPRQWAQESFDVTLDPASLYCVRAPDGCRYSDDALMLAPRGPRRTQAVDQDYLALFSPVAEQRVRLAGFRLAHLVNAALDPAYSQPVQNSSQPL